MSNPSQPTTIQNPYVQAPSVQAPSVQTPYVQAPYGQAAYGEAPYVQAPMTPAPSAPAGRSSMGGLPWFIVGATLLVVGFMQGARIPEMMQYKSSDAIVGNLTGVVALFGIGAALTAVGFVKRRQQR